MDDGRTAAGDAARGPAAAAREPFRPLRPARRLPLRRRGRLDQHCCAQRRGVAKLCAIVPALPPMADYGFRDRVERRTAIDDALAAWVRPQTADCAATELLRAGIPAAALATSRDLLGSNHLNERRFWDAYGAGVLPGLPWHASFGRMSGAAPELGADTDAVLGHVLGFSPAEIAALRKSGAFG